jgi:probable F420-dependent oxidoreductase
VDIGIYAWPTDRGLRPDLLAREVEDRGFAAMWVPEHTHVPTSRETPFPVLPGSDFPEFYAHMYDPLVALAAAAATTKRITLGTAVCLVAQRDPLILAKELACIDQLSDGRLKFGVGYGWLLEEMRNHGVDPRVRRGIVREKVAAINALWTSERAEFHGKHVSFAETWMWPKPVQQPRPPVLLGASPGGFPEIVDWADGWIAVDLPSTATDDIPALRRLAEERGRSADDLEIHICNVNHTYPASFDMYQAAGVTSVILHVPAGATALEGRDRTLAVLDQYTPLIDRYS